MGRYEHDPTQVVAALAILPKDDYEFKIGHPKPFERTAKKGHQSYGLMFPLTVVDGPQAGKKVLFRIYLHSEGAAQMAKRFQMAVFGLSTNEKNEKVFDAAVAGQDWSYDPETGELGEAWAEYEGKHVCCDLDVGYAKDETGAEMKDEKTGEPIEQQLWGTWRPIAGAGEAVPTEVVAG